MTDQTPEQGAQDDWLEGASIEAYAESLDVPGQSIPLDIEIPEHEHDGEPPAVA